MPRQLQRQLIVKRRARIQVIIAELGHVPNVREMSRLIRAEGFRGNHQTVFKDYRALGIEWERTRKAREEREQQSASSSLFYCMQGSVDKAA